MAKTDRNGFFAEVPMILQRLRGETRSQHEILDHHPLMVQLMSPALTVSHYEHLLKKFLGFYRPLEPILARFQHWSALGLDLNARAKTPRLIEDLTFLHASAPEPSLAPEPTWIHDEAAAMGTFYVLEGSTLGGQIISRHVTKHLGFQPHEGLSFFSSYGNEVGARWKETRDALERFETESGSADAMVTAAKQTFHALAEWLDAETELSLGFPGPFQPDHRPLPPS